MFNVQRYESWFDTPFGSRTDRVERRILSGLLSNLSGSKSLLDVGCGTGHFVDFWQSESLSTVGLDIAPALLRYACEHYSNTSFVLGDAHQLPFQDNSFDIVALITVLEFLSMPRQALEEAGRVARKGILLGVLNRCSPIGWWRRLRKAQSYRDARFYSAPELRELVQNSLVGREIELIGRSGLYPVSWLDGLDFFPFGAFLGMAVCFMDSYGLEQEQAGDY